MRRLTLLLLLTTVSCAQGAWIYPYPDGSHLADRDRYECEASARQASGMSHPNASLFSAVDAASMMERCLKGRGWKRYRSMEEARAAQQQQLRSAPTPALPTNGKDIRNPLEDYL